MIIRNKIAFRKPTFKRPPSIGKGQAACFRRGADIAPVDQLWCIAGYQGQGGGIIAWCYNESDAKHWLKVLKNDRRFSCLNAHKYLD